jgi:hypothetical protein
VAVIVMENKIIFLNFKISILKISKIFKNINLIFFKLKIFFKNPKNKK